MSIQKHTSTSLARRLGGLVPRSTICRWIAEGRLTPLSKNGPIYEFSRADIDRLELEAVSHLSDKLGNYVKFATAPEHPGGLSDGDLAGAFLRSEGDARTELWPEISRRLADRGAHMSGHFAKEIAKNVERAKSQPKFANYFNKQNNRTERQRVK